MDELLAYESRDSGTLEPGEELLWEGGGIRRGRARFRITNRRAFCVDGKENAAKHRGTVRWPFHSQITIGLPRRGGATIQFGTMLWIKQVSDWATVAGYLVDVNRGRLVRRRRARKATESAMDVVPMTEAVDKIDYSSVATDLGLLDGERVVWSGQPIRNQPIRWPVIRRKLSVIAMLIFPSVMAWRAVTDEHLEGVDVILGLVAAFWFLVAIHSLTTKPIIARWRLGRTRYVLTTRRVFVIEPAGGGMRVRFIFVDALGARFDRIMQSDGSGDLDVGHGIGFVQVPDAAAVHRQLADVVLAARRDLPDLGWQDSPAVM